MASNQTSNFQLSQWEANDEVLRADFNGDNLKIDTALTAMKAVTDVSFTPDRLPFAVGTYTGDGTTRRVISLGFTPRAVLVVMQNSRMSAGSGGTYYGGLAVTGHHASASAEGASVWIDAQTIVAIVEGGFQVGSHTNGPTVSSNAANSIYYYVALK